MLRVKNKSECRTGKIRREFLKNHLYFERTCIIMILGKAQYKLICEIMQALLI